MPGKKISLIGSSNHLTNNTNVFANMPGLAPTATVRPMVTSLPGYKHLLVAANGINWSDGSVVDPVARAKGCGLGKNPQVAGTLGKNCLNYLGVINTVNHRYQPSRGRILS